MENVVLDTFAKLVAAAIATWANCGRDFPMEGWARSSSLGRTREDFLLNQPSPEPFPKAPRPRLCSISKLRSCRQR